MFAKPVYEQAEKACLFAREYKLDAVADSMYGYRINGKHYADPLSFTVAIISAFDKVGIKVPEEIRRRPEPMYVGELK